MSARDEAVEVLAWSASRAGRRGPEAERLAVALEALLAEYDPIETGREAALGQWEARWAALRSDIKARSDMASADAYVGALSDIDDVMGEVEARIPVGLPVGERWVPRVSGRITLQLEPERAVRLVEVLKSAGAHPSGLGSYEAANDANALAEDLAAQMERT